jgi:hypothetical protein
MAMARLWGTKDLLVLHNIEVVCKTRIKERDEGSKEVQARGMVIIHHKEAWDCCSHVPNVSRTRVACAIADSVLADTVPNN